MGNWLYNSLLKQWCEENRVIYKEEKDMTKGARVTIKRICDELMKWCEERHVMCEFATTDDEGLSATFTVGGTTLSVSHIELRDADEFSRYVKNVLFGVDESAVIDKLKEEVAEKDDHIRYNINKIDEMADKIDDLNKEIVVKDDRIAYLQYELMNEHKERLYGQIGELEEELKKKDKRIASYADKINQLSGTNTILENKVKGLENEIKRLKSNGRILYLEECIENRDKTVKKLSEDNVSLSNQLEMKRAKISELEKELKKLRDEKDNCKYWLDIRGTKVAELNDAIEEKEKNLNRAADRIIQLACTNTILKSQIDGLRLQLKAERKGYGELEDQYDDKCKRYDSAKANCDKAEAKIEELKKENATLQYKIDALENNKKDLLSAYKKDLDNINNEIKRLKQQIM